MNKKNITKMIAIGALAISPWILNASVSHDIQTKDVQVSSISTKDVNALKRDALQGKRIDPSDLEKLLTGFMQYESHVADPKDEEGDQYVVDNLPSDAKGRQRELNQWIVKSMSAIDGNVESPEADSEEIAWGILDSLNCVNYDIQFMDHQGCQLEREVFGYLINYCDNITYGCFLSKEDKKEVAEAVITMLVNIPSLSKEYQKKVNECCFRIWDRFQNDILWEVPSKEEIQERNDKLWRHTELLREIIRQRDPNRRDEERAVAHKEGCLVVLQDILEDLLYLENYNCKINKSEEVKDVLKSLIARPGLSAEEKSAFKWRVEMSILCEYA